MYFNKINEKTLFKFILSLLYLNLLHILQKIIVEHNHLSVRLNEFTNAHSLVIAFERYYK